MGRPAFVYQKGCAVICAARLDIGSSRGEAADEREKSEPYSCHKQNSIRNSL